MSATIRFIQIRFAASDSSRPSRRTFPGPPPVQAIEEPLAEVEPALPHLVVALVPATCAKEWQPREEAFLASSPVADEASVSLASRGVLVLRRPGRAVLIGDPDRFADVIAALVELEFYEGELRRLERDLQQSEAEADGDVPHAFQIHSLEQRARFKERIEHFTRLRLDYARLEPHWLRPPRDLSPRTRRWLAKLLERVETEERAEAVSERLELREELYEGAVDRMADYAGWRFGHRLEIAIIVLLLLEVILISAELL